MTAGDAATDLDEWETRPCEPRVANEDAEDWCAIAQWESARADRWKAEVADLRRQLEERKSPDMVTVPREEWEALRELEHQAWSALDEVENHGECDMTGISGAYKAVKESRALRSGEDAK